MSFKRLNKKIDNLIKKHDKISAEIIELKKKRYLLKAEEDIAKMRKREQNGKGIKVV